MRIRPAYVAAIEDDRFDQLPGRAYATGFVRAYADFLGADVEATNTAAVAEINRLPAPELRVRKPQVERGSRLAPLAAASICLALAGYVYWYFDNTRARFETAADTLARIDAPNFVENGASSIAAAPTPYRPFPDATAPMIAAAPQDVAPAPQAPQPAPATAVPTAAPPQPAENQPPRPPSRKAPHPSASDLAEAPQPAPLPAPAALAANLPAPRLEAPAAKPSWSIPAPGSAMASTAHGLDLSRLPQPASLAGETPPPAPGKVTLRAVADTWIHITAVKTGKVLFSRVLRVGETYEAPDRQGLRMTVGNAGGLEILVDGAVAPKLGAHGEVVRDVDLTGSNLLAQN